MTTRAAKSSKPGARPRGPFEGKRKTLTTRITEKTRERLEKAAQEAGRSLSQEIELRLERSFERGDIAEQVLGGPDLVDFIPVLRLIFDLIRKETGAEYVWTHPPAFSEIESALVSYLRELRKGATRKIPAPTGMGVVIGSSIAKITRIKGTVITDEARKLSKSIEDLSEAETEEFLDRVNARLKQETDEV